MLEVQTITVCLQQFMCIIIMGLDSRILSNYQINTQGPLRKKPNINFLALKSFSHQITDGKYKGLNKHITLYLLVLSFKFMLHAIFHAFTVLC